MWMSSESDKKNADIMDKKSIQIKKLNDSSMFET